MSEALGAGQGILADEYGYETIDVMGASQESLASEYDYETIDTIPLLCDSCHEPLTLSTKMQSLVIATRPGDTPVQISDQDLHHACGGQDSFDPMKVTSTAEKHALKFFQSHLKVDDYDKIQQETTFADVLQELLACKNAQDAVLSKRSKNHEHLDKLLQRIHVYSGIVDSALQNTVQPASLIWSSMKFLIQVTSSYMSIQTRMANMLIEIADSLGRVELFKDLYPTEHIQCTVATLYAEIVDLLRSMISFWHKHRFDKKILHAFWKPFEVEYQVAATRIRYLVDQVDKTATASHMAITKTQNMDILLAIRGIQARLDEHHNYLLILQENTSIARTYSLRLRQYLISDDTQDMQERLVHFHLARQSSRAYNFVLQSDYYLAWSQSRGSKILGLVGGTGSGKTAVSVFIFNKIKTLASSGAPVLFLNCMPGTNTSRMNLLQYTIWQIMEQRPDILFRKIRSEGYYVKMFRQATTFEELWSIFKQIVKALDELWIVLDSIHDCSDGKEAFMKDLMALVKKDGLGTRIKLAISSRHVSDVETVSDSVMQYSAQDMQESTMAYISHEASIMGDRGAFLMNHASEISAAIGRIGGVPALRRPLVHLVMSTKSDDEAQRTLTQITDVDSLINSLWDLINRRPEPRRSLLIAMTKLIVQTGGQFTVMQIYNALRESGPHLLKGVDITFVGDLVKEELSPYTSMGHGFFLMDNVVRQNFRRFFPEPEEEKPQVLENIEPCDEQERVAVADSQRLARWIVDTRAALRGLDQFFLGLGLALFFFLCLSR